MFDRVTEIAEIGPFENNTLSKCCYHTYSDRNQSIKKRTFKPHIPTRAGKKSCYTGINDLLKMTRELEGLRMENENYYCWDPIVEKYLCLIMKPILLPLEDNIQKTKSIEVYEKESTMLL